jgi:polysaccharide export outer membrane protein
MTRSVSIAFCCVTLFLAACDGQLGQPPSPEALETGAAGGPSSSPAAGDSLSSASEPTGPNGSGVPALEGSPALQTGAAAAETGAEAVPTSVEQEVSSPARAVASDLARLQQLADQRSRRRRDEPYRIGPGDLLEINVFDLPEMNRKVRVGQSGYIQLPLIGAVEAAGRTEAGLSAEIAVRLERDYLNNAQVDVFVEEYKSQQVAVTGAVAKPGLYPLTRDRYTILDMISEAGGLTKDAGSVIEFIPGGSGTASSPFFAVASTGSGLPPGAVAAEALARAEAISIDLNELLRGGTREVLNVPVAAGDVIYVPEAGTFTIEGWVDKPGTYPLSRTSTILAAISAGGGPLLPAKLRSVRLLRDRGDPGGTREVIEVDVAAIREGQAPDVPLRSGDIVRVPGSLVLVVPWGFYTFVKNLVSIGASIPIL